MASAVPVSRPRSAFNNNYWIVPAVRAVLALAVGFAITFTKDIHTAFFGLITFGLFAIVEGLATGVLSVVFSAGGLSRTFFVIQGIVGLVAGVLALVLAHNGLGMFLYLVTGWAALTGFLELCSGLRERHTGNHARDWIFIGAITIVLALVLLFVPADPLLAIGLFGAWAVIAGVFHGIAAASLRFASRSSAGDVEQGSVEDGRKAS